MNGREALRGLGTVGLGATIGGGIGALSSLPGLALAQDATRRERLIYFLTRLTAGSAIGGITAGANYAIDDFAIQDAIANGMINKRNRGTSSMNYNDSVKTASATESMIRNQAVRAALPDAGVGAAFGAGVGGLLGLVGPSKNRLRRALMFALGGGLAGGAGAGIASYNGASLLDAVQNKLDQWRAQRHDKLVSEGTREPARQPAVEEVAAQSDDVIARAKEEAANNEAVMAQQLNRLNRAPVQPKMHPAVQSAMKATSQGERDYWLGLAGLLPPMN